jgi:hypothetical protein
MCFHVGHPPYIHLTSTLHPPSVAVLPVLMHSSLAGRHRRVSLQSQHSLSLVAHRPPIRNMGTPCTACWRCVQKKSPIGYTTPGSQLHAGQADVQAADESCAADEGLASRTISVSPALPPSYVTPLLHQSQGQGRRAT